MGTMKKLLTLFRGQLRQGTEAVIDANALALLDQQLFDTEQAIISARRELASLMAERKLLQASEKQLMTDIDRYESYTREALARQQDKLAEDTAAEVADLEQALAETIEQRQQLTEREVEFRAVIDRAGKTLAALRREQAVARVSDRIHDVSCRLGDGGSSLQGQLAQSEETLLRIRQRQARMRAHWQARCELQHGESSNNLQQRLEDAGIVPGRNKRSADVLARIRAGEPSPVTTV